MSHSLLPARYLAVQKFLEMARVITIGKEELRESGCCYDTYEIEGWLNRSRLMSYAPSSPLFPP